MRNGFALIDVVNDFDFEEGEELFRLALPVGRNIAALKKRCKAAGNSLDLLHALKQMETVLKADVGVATELDLRAISR